MNMKFEGNMSGEQHDNYPYEPEFDKELSAILVTKVPAGNSQLNVIDKDALYRNILNAFGKKDMDEATQIKVLKELIPMSYEEIKAKYWDYVPGVESSSEQSDENGNEQKTEYRTAA